MAAFHAGANDVLRPRTDVAAVLRRYDRAVESLTDRGVPTLLFTVIERAGGTGRTVAARFAAFNAGVLETLGVRDPVQPGDEPGWWQVPLRPGQRTGRRADLLADVRWVRGVSSGDGPTAKHTTLVDVTAVDVTAVDVTAQESSDAG